MQCFYFKSFSIILLNEYGLFSGTQLETMSNWLQNLIFFLTKGNKHILLHSKGSHIFFLTTQEL